MKNQKIHTKTEMKIQKFPNFEFCQHIAHHNHNNNIKHIQVHQQLSSLTTMSATEESPLVKSTELKTSKLWTWPTIIRDHTRFTWMLPSYLSAYILPGYSLSPTTIESVMVTMNTINTCPYCTGLHGQLARMAGVDEPDATDAEVIFSTVFATESGRGETVDKAYETLVSKIGEKKAQSVRALCWALLWGKTTGNTINNGRDKILKLEWTSLRTVELFVLVYYGPLFLVIGGLNKILTMAPGIPKFVSAGLGAVLWLPQALNIIPLGLVSIVLKCGVV